MLSEQDKKEMLEDALSEDRRKAFEEADRRAEVFTKKYQASMTADKAIKFLMDTQELIGPFPISKIVSNSSQNFKL